MRRRPCLAALCAVVILAAGSPSLARVGGPIKQVPTIPVPRLPSTPTAPESSTKEPEAMLTCDLLNKMIAGLKAERGALEKAAAEVKAVRARAAAGGENAQQERLMAVFQANAEKDEKYYDCLEAVMLKDPDYPKYERLEMPAEAELDEEKTAKLSEQAEALHDVIKKRAEPACASLKGSTIYTPTTWQAVGKTAWSPGGVTWTSRPGLLTGAPWSARSIGRAPST